MADYSDAYKGQPPPTWDDVDKAFKRGYNSGYKAGYANAHTENLLVPSPARCPDCQAYMWEDEGQEHVCNL